LGSDNAINVVHATVTALKNIQTPQAVAKRRGKTPEEVAPAYLLRSASPGAGR
jgi:small subunit ribosomal protein S5